jgi:hypothetical protein
MVPKTFNGLPTHALAVHAAVVLVPLAALLAVLFVIPRTRRWATLPMPLVTLAALISLYVARASGYNLKAYFVKVTGGGSNFDTSVLGKAIKTHEDRANTLFYLMIVFAIVVLAVWYLSRDATRFSGAIEIAACALLVVGSILVVIQVIRVGDAGARAVWNPDGSTHYGISSVSSRVPSS